MMRKETLFEACSTLKMSTYNSTWNTRHLVMTAGDVKSALFPITMTWWYVLLHSPCTFCSSLCVAIQPRSSELSAPILAEHVVNCTGNLPERFCRSGWWLTSTPTNSEDILRKTTWFQDRWRSPLPFVLVRFIMAPYCSRFFGSCLIDPFTTVYLECSNSAYSTKLGDFTHHTSGEFCESLITFPQKIQRPCQRMMGGGTITYSEEYFRIHYHSQKVIWSIINLQSSSESSNFQGFPFNEQQLSLSNFIFDKYRSQFLEC